MNWKYLEKYPKYINFIRSIMRSKYTILSIAMITERILILHGKINPSQISNLNSIKNINMKNKIIAILHSKWYNKED